jgi:hypothetical protein
MTYQPAPDHGSIQTSAILLIILGFLCGGWIPTIFGIIALVQMNTDPASARTMNKVGWIILWVILGLAVLAILAYVVFGLALFGIVGLGAAG